MSAHDPSILDYSIFISPPFGSLMVALRAYGDESGKENDPNTPIISMGLVMGDTGQWLEAEKRWNDLLIKHEIPFVHMKEVKGGKGPFKRFRKPARMISLLDDIADIIIQSDLVCRSLAVHRDHFRKVCDEYDVDTNLYSFTLYLSALMTGTVALNYRPQNPSLQIILDRIEKGTALVAEAERLYLGSNHISWRGWPLVSALSPQDPKGSKDFAGLQMADVIAWHSRNELLTEWEWFKNVKPLLGENNPEAWDISLSNWYREKASSFTGDRADFNKYNYVFDRLKEAKRLLNRSYDYERLKNHIFKHYNLDPPRELRQDAINKCGRVFPLTP